MNKSDMDRQRGSVLYQDEVLKVIYTGDACNFPKNTVIEARPKLARRSGLPYPEPKWIACDYWIYDLDGDPFNIAKDRYGKLHTGFEWIK